jgi:alkylhydroperoxidase family enzyme
LPRARWGHVDAPTQRIFEKLYEERGNVPNLFRVLAHRPKLMTTFTHHFQAVLGTGTVSTRFKELLAVRVSTINGCEY